MGNKGIHDEVLLEENMETTILWRAYNMGIIGIVEKTTEITVS